MSVNSRIVHKHDTEANWLKAVNFVPLEGELILYDVDETHDRPRFKVGDGKTLVSALPFSETEYVVDTFLSSTSTNPVQNKVVANAVSNLNNLVGSEKVSEQITNALKRESAYFDENAPTIEGIPPVDSDSTGGGSSPTLSPGSPNTVLVTNADGDVEWQERTHYSEIIDTDIYPETTVTGENGYYDIYEPYAFYPKLGETYTVTLNTSGAYEQFSCVAKTFELDGVPCITLGNLGALMGDESLMTEDPFTMVLIPEEIASSAGMYGFIMMLSGEGDGCIFSVSGKAESVHKIDKKYIPNVGASSLSNGSASGSVKATLGYQEDDEYKIGEHAFAWRGKARGPYSVALAGEANGEHSISAGGTADGDSSFTANAGTTTASGYNSFAVNSGETSGHDSFAAGWGKAKARFSSAFGRDTIASGIDQHVQGRYNVEDTEGQYTHIVGNGSSSKRANAHTLDWGGNAWYSGNVYVGGTKQSEGTKLVTQSELETAISDSSELFIVRYDQDTGLMDKTQAEIRAAVAQKIPCIAMDNLSCVYNYVGEEPFIDDKNVLVPTFRRAMDYDGNGGIEFIELQVPQTGGMRLWGNTNVKAPNPKSLRLTGAVSATYDGSTDVTVEIPEVSNGSGEDIFIVHFNEQGNTAEEPIEDIITAIEDGKVVIGIKPSGEVYTYSGLRRGSGPVQGIVHTFQAHINYSGGEIASSSIYTKPDNSGFIELTNKPSAKNPYKLILTGAVAAEYDGSKQVVIDIPTVSGDGSGGSSVEFVSDEEVLEALVENDLILAVGTEDSVLCDENGSIIEW